jgi:hypothetical protein
MPTIAESFTLAKAQWATEGRLLVEGEVREGLAEGRYGLKNRTGNLMNRTLSALLPERDGFKTGTNIDYGRGWELGFKRPEVLIFPKRAKALRFTVGGKAVFAKRVRLPEKTFRARPWIQPAIAKMMPELQSMADSAFQHALVKSFPDRTIEV